MARLASTSFSASSIDRVVPSYSTSYTTVTHTLSNLCIEVLALLGKGITTEDLIERLVKSTDADLSVLDTDLQLFSQHKLTSSDRDAREVLASIRGIIATVQEGRTPQGILMQNVLNKFSQGTTLAEVCSLLEAESSETLSKLTPCLDRVSTSATPEGKSILDKVKELAEVIREQRTPEGMLARQILSQLNGTATAEEVDKLLGTATDETLRNLPKCLDRVIRDVPESRTVLEEIKVSASAVVETRTPLGVLARRTLAAVTDGSQSQLEKLLKDASNSLLESLSPYLDRRSSRLSAPEQAAILEVKTWARQEVENRTAGGRFALLLLDLAGRSGGEAEILDSLKRTSSETLTLARSHVDRIGAFRDRTAETGKVQRQIAEVLESRTGHGVLAGNMLQTLEECPSHSDDRKWQKASASHLISLLQGASVETLRAVPAYLERVLLQTPEVERASKSAAMLWINTACLADLQRRELGRPPSSLRLERLPFVKGIPIGFKVGVAVAVIVAIIFAAYFVFQ